MMLFRVSLLFWFFKNKQISFAQLSSVSPIFPVNVKADLKEGFRKREHNVFSGQYESDRILDNPAVAYRFANSSSETY